MCAVTQIKSIVVYSYLQSNQFTGVCLATLANKLGIDEHTLRLNVSNLIYAGDISLGFNDLHKDNTILAVWPDSAETQLNKLQSLSLSEVTAFPTKNSLSNIVNIADYDNRPFSLQLAFGCPQLCYECFNINILELYQNMPEHVCHISDIGGSINLADNSDTNSSTTNSAKLIDSFGFCTSSDGTRAIAVFLKYLNNLPSTHQKTWANHLISEECKLHPDYLACTFGLSQPKLSVLQAFSIEIKLINEMCIRMNRPPLFFNVPANESKQTTPLRVPIRSTKAEFSTFVSALDSLMSDNLNKDFFKDEISGSPKKGAIRMLDDWLTVQLNTANSPAVQRLITQFKLVRRMRQRQVTTLNGKSQTAHPEYLKRQRELILDSYNALRLLRFTIGRHPQAQGITVPEQISLGEISCF